MSKETKAMIYITSVVSICFVSIEYLNGLSFFRQLTPVLRIFIAGIIGGVVGLVFTSIAYLCDKYIKSEKGGPPISFWKYILIFSQPQKGKLRRAITAGFVASCIILLHELGYFVHLNLVARFFIGVVLGVSIGLLVEYVAKIVPKQKTIT
ncbi:MAG: hypothetical protein K6357_05865 [Elusimicrobiota bacterium]